MIFVFVSVNTSPKRRVNVDATRGPTRVDMTQKYDTIANVKNLLRGNREVEQFGFGKQSKAAPSPRDGRTIAPEEVAAPDAGSSIGACDLPIVRRDCWDLIRRSP